MKPEWLEYRSQLSKRMADENLDSKDALAIAIRDRQARETNARVNQLARGYDPISLFRCMDLNHADIDFFVGAIGDAEYFSILKSLEESLPKPANEIGIRLPDIPVSLEKFLQGLPSKLASTPEVPIEAGRILIPLLHTFSGDSGWETCYRDFEKRLDPERRLLYLHTCRLYAASSITEDSQLSDWHALHKRLCSLRGDGSEDNSSIQKLKGQMTKAVKHSATAPAQCIRESLLDDARKAAITLTEAMRVHPTQILMAFGSTRSKSANKIIPDLMDMAEAMISSNMGDEITQPFLERLTACLANHCTKEMNPPKTEGFFEAVKDHVRWDSVVGMLSKRGRSILVDNFKARDYYFNYMKRGELKRAFESDLGI